MQEERLQVLKMVDEGKITVDEATKLLDALKGTAAMHHAAVAPSPNFEEKFNSFTKDTKEFFKDVGSKINHMYKEAEPKIKSATKAVVCKTANLADNISQSLNEKAKNMESAAQNTENPCHQTTDAPADNGPKPE